MLHFVLELITHLHIKLTKQILNSPQSESRLWKDTIVYSLIIFTIISGYYYATNATFSDKIFNRAIADVSILLMGVSLILSSVCYFWNFADKYIIYRKHLGLVGAGYMIFHVVLSIFMTPYTPFATYYLDDKRISSFFAALVATIIFIIMSLLSNRFAIQEIGPQRWRKIMRFSYIGFILVLFHFGKKGMQYWIPWFAGKTESIFPSFGLIVFLFGIVVIVLRIALWFSTMQKSEIIRNS